VNFATVERRLTSTPTNISVTQVWPQQSHKQEAGLWEHCEIILLAAKEVISHGFTRCWSSRRSN